MNIKHSMGFMCRASSENGVLFSSNLVFFSPNSVSWILVTCFICVHLQRVHLGLTRCPPGSRSAFPVQPTVWQKRMDLWCVCVRRTTSEHPWIPPQHPAQVIQLFNVVQSLMSCLKSVASPGLFDLFHTVRVTCSERSPGCS